MRVSSLWCRPDFSVVWVQLHAYTAANVPDGLIDSKQRNDFLVTARMSMNRVFLNSVHVFMVLTLLGVGCAHAATNPFAGGWELDTTTSSLSVLSVKNETKIETSRIASFQGGIDETGATKLTIQLDSVDTGIDLRNVRMRFLFFETFLFPEAIVTARIEPEWLEDLHSRRRIVVPVSFELDLHGVKKTLAVDTVVTRFSDTMVSVASLAPVPVIASLFGLDDGVAKLEDAASVDIIPAGSVSFNLNFFTQVDKPDVALGTDALVNPSSTALESRGDFSLSECAGRFEILSRAGAIYFNSGSARLDSTSIPLLDTVAMIIRRCPSINLEISGHTDASGSVKANQRLSELRANSVLQHLVSSGISADRLRSVGYGEERPVVANDSERNRQRNRRIEFSIVTGSR